jgi:hypothetical protein
MRSISFTLDQDAACAFIQHYYTISPSVRSTRAKCRWLFPGILTGFSLINLLIDPDILLVSILLSLAAIGFVLYPKYYDWSLAKAAKRISAEPNRQKMYGDYTVAFTDEGIVSCGPKSRGTYFWQAVDRVTLTEDYLFIYLGGAVGYPIRRSQVGEEAIIGIKAFVDEKIAARIP